MKSNLSYFSGSFIFAIVCMVFAGFYGGPQAMFIVGVLGVLETSLSFDNAVVNATILRDWNDYWRKIFLTVGIIIAVFGMRVLFPIVIVQFTTSMSFMDAARLAFTDPATYAEKVTGAHDQIAGFGGAFLMMVFLKFFFDREKDVHWIKFIEAPLTKLGRMDMVEALITVATLFSISKLLPEHSGNLFFMAGLLGVGVYIIVDGLGALLESESDAPAAEQAESGNNVAAAVGKQGIFGFLYLEVLDASFSFDGVIGAFALTNNIIIIALGLGIGAMFVRSFTLFLVDKGTLSEFKYLEHGAFWAIGALALIMMVGVKVHINEVFTGGIGLAFVGLAFWSSLRHRKAEQIESGTNQ